jgi:putative transposase
VSTVGANKKTIQAYIKNQEIEDIMADQLSFKEFEDPFKNLPGLDDDSPEVPADSETKK